ncbi:hypothetical protein AB0F17_57425 [Nonomuraea sp. NPDC026600]|uniref:hypothetical protein n=1 Tax=Nonomuraea sp. NPDC026600 TaxID=3155363 RepID=UPI00340230FF
MKFGVPSLSCVGARGCSVPLEQPQVELVRAGVDAVAGANAADALLADQGPQLVYVRLQTCDSRARRPLTPDQSDEEVRLR